MFQNPTIFVHIKQITKFDNGKIYGQFIKKRQPKLPLFVLGFGGVMDHNAFVGKYLNIGYFCAIDIDLF